MNVIAVDDETLSLKGIERVIKNVIEDCNLNCFNKPNDALFYAQENRIDVAFLDINMISMNGLELAKKLKDIYCKTNIVFVTGYSKYAIDSYGVDTSDYLLKPVTIEKITRALARLRDPVKPETHIARAQCFGNFEIFANEIPLRFARTKTKELLAYLISREGAFCSNNEIIAVIWEKKDDTPALQSQFRNLVMDLNKTLKAAGIKDILIKRRGQLAVAAHKLACDMYESLKGDDKAINSFRGEFMSQYTWAEFDTAFFRKKHLN